MIKRISCRVVRSVPLSKSNHTLWNASRSSNKHHKIGDIVATDVRLRHTSNLVTYTGRSGVARISIDNGPMKQILDCYA